MVVYIQSSEKNISNVHFYWSRMGKSIEIYPLQAGCIHPLRLALGTYQSILCFSKGLSRRDSHNFSKSHRTVRGRNESDIFSNKACLGESRHTASSPATISDIYHRLETKVPHFALPLVESVLQNNQF